MKAQLAFYIGKGNIVDKAIRLWTKSKYSHVELILNDEWYSTSPRLLQVSKRYINPNIDSWEYVEIEIDTLHISDFYEKTAGKKYDWLGIALSQFMPFDTQSKDRWFCSEWCAEALKLSSSNRYSPEKLYQHVKGYSA